MKGRVEVPVSGRKELFWYAGIGDTGNPRSLIQIPVLDDCDFVATKMFLVAADGSFFDDVDLNARISKNNRQYMLIAGLSSAMQMGDRTIASALLGLPAPLFIERKSSVFIDLVKHAGNFTVAPYVVLEGYKIYQGTADDIPMKLDANYATPFFLGNNATTLAVGDNTISVQAQAEGDFIAKALQVSKDNGTFELPADTLIRVRDNNGKDWNNIPIPLFCIANKRAAATNQFTPFAYPRLVKGFNVITIGLTVSAGSGVQTGVSAFFPGVKSLPH